MSYPIPYTHALTVEGRRREFERKVLSTGCLVLAALSTRQPRTRSSAHSR